MWLKEVYKRLRMPTIPEREPPQSATHQASTLNQIPLTTMAITPLSPTDPSNLKGISILITGGASGLGKHAATFFAKSGAFVTIADIQVGSAIASELSEQGYKVQFVYCDITSWDSQVSAF
jgi:5'-hydroxyaverantin dehydrogenase